MAYTEKALPVGGMSEEKLALATATPEDVASGKTFYSGDKELKTGTRGSVEAISSQNKMTVGKTYVIGFNVYTRPGYMPSSLNSSNITGGTVIAQERVCYADVGSNWAYGYFIAIIKATSTSIALNITAGTNTVTYRLIQTD